MEQSILCNILQKKLKNDGFIELKVSGCSMLPILCNGDTVCINTAEDYAAGDILVFVYKFASILIHRLVNKNNLYECKGDNSFRLETVQKDMIVGKVTKVNNCPVDNWPQWKIDFSYMMNRLFFHYRYDTQKTKEDKLYKLYEILILNNENENILFMNSNKTISYTIPTNNSFLNKDQIEIKQLERTIQTKLNVPCSFPELLKYVNKNCGYISNNQNDLLSRIIFQKICANKITFYEPE